MAIYLEIIVWESIIVSNQRSALLVCIHVGNPNEKLRPAKKRFDLTSIAVVISFS